ncbi:MAG: hypothetical protein KDC24_11090, partial [Saprospiraceae bacterium]|nr:hypothetical protein [Saprospiraceae bacterium]
LNRADSNGERIDWIEKRDAEKVIRRQELIRHLTENPECAEGEQLQMREAYNRFKTIYLP